MIEDDPCLNLVLQDRFIIVRYFSQGSYGRLYEAIDESSADKKVVLIKISSELEMSMREYGILKQINKLKQQGGDNVRHFPKVYAGGEFVLQDKQSQPTRHAYIIMEKLGKSLQTYLKERNKTFSLKTVCQVGIQLLDILEQVHRAGYVYNDLKFDNILVGDGCNSPESLS